MELLKILAYPEKVLRKKCEKVEEIRDSETALFDKMLYTMKYYKGIGLAGPQIGLSKKLIVVDIGEGAVKPANPEIIKKSGTGILEEGCLSIPNKKVNVKRPYKVVVNGLNHQGETVEIKAEGLLARVFQHEIDHLSGKLIIDYLPFFERLKFKFREVSKW